MKKVVAYVNTMRVHWLVEALEAIGIQHIMVVEYFSPLSRVSRFAFLCEDNLVETARETIHRVGTNGSSSDHLIDVSDYVPTLSDTLPLGQRMSQLED